MVLENSNDVVTPETEQGGLTRRSLVRTGATAAWTVPVITAVAAAPALATTPPPATGADLSTSTGTVTSSSGNGSGSLTIKNLGTRVTTTLSVVITISSGKFQTFSVSSAGWTSSPTTFGGTVTAVTMTADAAHQCAGGGTAPLAFTFTTNGNSKRSGTVAINPGTDTGFTTTAGSVTF